MPSHTPDQIIKMVDDMERSRSALHNRMDNDFDLYNLEPYAGEVDAKGVAVLDNNKKFTANDPRTSANLALHILSTARRITRRHKPRAQKEQREIDNFGEMFDLGMLQAIDERRHKLMMPDLQDSLASQDLLRGGWAQRVLLVKEDLDEEDLEPEISEQERNLVQGAGFGDFPPAPTTRTYVDVIDWDPRNTYWKMGKHGLLWACNKSWKTADEIEAEYGKRPEGAGEDNEDTFPIYDFFDETHNIVVTEKTA